MLGSPTHEVLSLTFHTEQSLAEVRLKLTTKEREASFEKAQEDNDSTLVAFLVSGIELEVAQ